RVRVGVVEEPAFFYQQRARVGAGRVARVPADGPLARGVTDRRNGLGDLGALDVLGHPEVIAPPVAVRRRLVPAHGELARDDGVALERTTARVDRRLDAVVVEQA